MSPAVAGGPAWLFCPADRPERWSTAVDRADVVILDLEDAVAPAAKSAARQALRERGLPGGPTVLRINAAGTPDHDLDRELLADLHPTAVMLPKAEDPAAVRTLDAYDVVVLIESPLGLDRVSELVALPNVVGAMWGAEDLVAAMGGTSGRHPDGTFRALALHARHRTLVAAKAHGRYALDAVHMDIADDDGLRAECLDAAAVGFDATVAIHPRQVPVIREAYRPAPDELARARAVLAAVGDGGGVTTVEGRMVDGPVVRQAHRIVQRATATS